MLYEEYVAVKEGNFQYLVTAHVVDVLNSECGIFSLTMISGPEHHYLTNE